MIVASSVALEIRARVVQVVDPNTLKINWGRDRTRPGRCRLLGVATPARDHPDPELRTIAAHAQEFVEVLVLGKDVVVHLFADQGGEDGRSLAVVFWRDAAGGWNNLNEDLVENGLAVATLEEDEVSMEAAA